MRMIFYLMPYDNDVWHIAADYYEENNYIVLPSALRRKIYPFEIGYEGFGWGWGYGDGYGTGDCVENYNREELYDLFNVDLTDGTGNADGYGFGNGKG